MSKLALGFGFTLLAAILIGFLALGFTAARANLVQAQANSYQAQANAAQAATNFVDKCLTGVLFVAMLFAGITIGAGYSKLQALLRKPAPAAQPIQGAWKSGPNAYWGRQVAPRPAMYQLPAPQAQYPALPPYYQPQQAAQPIIVIQQPEGMVMAEDETLDPLFGGWGYENR